MNRPVFPGLFLRWVNKTNAQQLQKINETHGGVPLHIEGGPQSMMMCNPSSFVGTLPRLDAAPHQIKTYGSYVWIIAAEGVPWVDDLPSNAARVE